MAKNKKNKNIKRKLPTPKYPIKGEYLEASDCIQELKKSLLKIGLPEDNDLFIEFKKIAWSTLVSFAEKENFSTVNIFDNSRKGAKDANLACIDATFLDFYVEFEIMALHAIMSGISAGVSQFLTSVENDLNR